jgi:hypothetical protein
MTTHDLTAMLITVQTRRDQYKTRLHKLHRIITIIEHDELFKDNDTESYESLLDEAATVHLDCTKNLYLYNPLIKHLKEQLAKTTAESPAYYTLLDEHYATLLAISDTRLSELEEYLDLLEEAYALHLELLSE